MAPARKPPDGSDAAHTKAAIEYIFHHTFLPPKLPQGDDFHEHLEAKLLSETVDAFTAFKKCMPAEHRGHIQAAIDMLSAMKIDANDKGIRDLLQNVVTRGQALVLHVRAQNAGVLITKDSDGEVRFDVLELSAKNDAVMSTKGRLQRSFPGASVSLPVDKVKEEGFRDAVAHALSSLSKHDVSGMQPTARKSGTDQVEDRDTCNPSMVTEVFTGFLTALGRPVESPEITKFTPEEVLWDDVRSPWHRSASWLLLKVALQLTLRRATGSNSLYKQAMLFVTTCMLQSALTILPKDALMQKDVFSRDMIHAMGCKVVRRLSKLGDDVEDTVVQRVDKVTKDAISLLEEAWADVRKEDTPTIDLTALRGLNFDRDANIDFPKLEDFITSINKRTSQTGQAPFKPSSCLVTYTPDSLPQLSTDSSLVIQSLLSFETWIGLHLNTWVESHCHETDVCYRLQTLMQAYYDRASDHYNSNPELLSVMLLTVAELWVALDRSAVHQIQLLRAYPPGFGSDVFQNLLLPNKSQMIRLTDIETYLNNRHATATRPWSKFYSDINSRGSFAMCYFDQDLGLQREQKVIVEAAEAAKATKLQELARVKEQHRSLMQQHNAREKHDQQQRTIRRGNKSWNDEYHDANNCLKCSYQRQADALDITIHEWPLPTDANEAKAVVFELHVPQTFSALRDADAFILHKVLKMIFTKSMDNRDRKLLSGDPHLRQYQRKVGGRITLMSLAKGNIQTHRKQLKVADATESKACLPNGFQYKYYDTSARVFVAAPQKTDDTAHSLTYKLPTRSQALQKYLFRPSREPDGPEHNVVIASQFNCPEHMTLDEYVALSSVPLGHSLQWHNMLRELEAPSVDFKKDEVAIFFMQCIYQAGPPNEAGARVAHRFLGGEGYGLKVLSSLATAFHRVKENWESAQAISVFAAITSRLLSLTDSQAIRTRCLAFLDSIRMRAFTWVELLRNKAQLATTDEVRAEMAAKSIDVALICALCADVDVKFLPEILGRQETCSMFIQCCIVVREGGKRSYLASTQPYLALLSHRFTRLLWRAVPSLRQNTAGIDAAIKSSWPAYESGHGWEVCSGCSGHWIHTQTANLEGKNASLSVHYDLLGGELLVNGLPLGRPQDEYQKQPLWSVLFGNAAVEVMPTNMPAMQHSAKRLHHGYNVHLGLDRSAHFNGLILRASIGGTVYELLSADLLSGKLPQAFVQEFVHWYNTTDECVEFRPKIDPWGAPTWVMHRNAGSGWRLTSNGYSVLGTESTTAKVIGNILAPLTERPHIHCILNESGQLLEIEIPLIRVNFFLERGQSTLQSREFRGMMVDDDQSLDTLVGFRNKLLLKQETGTERAVLVPEGEVSYEAGNGHVVVRVVKSSITKVHYLTIDRQLARLIDNGSLGIKLYLAYIHALTTSSLPDPLLGMTGTERALTILRSGTVRSFEQLSADDIRMLCNIAALTPGRSFYPANLQEMQTVRWNCALSSFAQHNDLFVYVEDIFDQAERNQILYQDSEWQRPKLKQPNSHLMQRDSIRASTFRVSGFGAESFTRQHDVLYKGRDRAQGSTRGTRAHIMSSLVARDDVARYHDPPTAAQLWNAISGSIRVHDPDSATPAARQPITKNVVTLVNEGLDTGFVLSLHRVIGHVASSGTAASISDYQLMMWLSYLAARDNADLAILQSFALLRTIPALRQLTLPHSQAFRPLDGYQTTREKIESVIREHVVPLQLSPEASLDATADETWHAFDARQAKLFDSRQSTAVNWLRDGLFAQAQSATPNMPSLPAGSINVADYILLDAAFAAVQAKFRIWYDNRQLFRYLQQIEAAIRNVEKGNIFLPQWRVGNPAIESRKDGHVSVKALFSGTAPRLPTSDRCPPLLVSRQTLEPRFRRLPLLLGRLEKLTGSKFEKRYANELQDSHQSLNSQHNMQQSLKDTFSVEDAYNYMMQCSHHASQVYGCIVAHLRSASSKHRSLLHSPVLCDRKQWPRVSASFLIQQLNPNAWAQLDDSWKQTVVEYGKAIVEVQRAERVLKAARAGKQEDVVKEFCNVPHSNWEPLLQPGWLLLEIEASVTIRPVQVDIARQMMLPASQRNAVMQLNMGEGKSSIIVPMIASALADSTQLLRVVVAKPQSKQMQHTLRSRIGDLLNRKVFFLPFSRSLKIDQGAASSIDAMMRECMAVGGVLLMLPEHILSFKLAALENTNLERRTVAASLLRTQDFFNSKARDIIDEADEIMNVKMELIYTMGQQGPIELESRRWGCIQQVLGLVRDLALDISKQPHFMEYNKAVVAGFPRIRLLKQEAEDLLIARLADCICESGLDGFPIDRQSKALRDAVKTYITKPELNSEETSSVEDVFLKDSTFPVLLLIRGLLAGGVLGFILAKKRWRVNYGLTSTRTPSTKLSVPYASKDQPSARSEFSHPEVIIMLTCLCYYYDGLEEKDLLTAFGHMLESDQAVAEYSLWLKESPNMPTELCQLEGVNLRDRQQCEEVLFPNMRYSKPVTDYFLSNIVFPKELREFPEKLSASGWNIAQASGKLTTGFSGTNDSRMLMPLDMEQLDLPNQRHTNALVLEYLLQPENSLLMMAKQHDNSISDADHLLSTIVSQEPPVRVILDAGAQVLELDNRQVAHRWLQLTPSDQIKAVVFVDESDEVTVLDRRDREEPLRTSPYLNSLDLVLVFLDEAHTRGIDLKLPQNYRAAVTLGPALPKDKLVQACLRMRALGNGQSVVFCLNEEIQNRVRLYTSKAGNEVLGVDDILLWAIGETFTVTRRAMPLWAVQGQRFLRQREVGDKLKRNGVTTMSKIQSDEFLEKEAQSLDDRYRPKSRSDDISIAIPNVYDDIQKRCREFDGLQYNASALAEEQERELSPEIEQERMVQRPDSAQPLKHSLHVEVQQFITTGKLFSKPTGYMPAFECLKDTSAGRKLETCQLLYDDDALLVTLDFARTISTPNNRSRNLDAYQRPVQWVLTRRGTKHDHIDLVMIISPFEAQHFMEFKAVSKQVTLHVYKARCNLAHAKFDDLAFLTFPETRAPPRANAELSRWLSLFAGQLYFAGMDDYRECCRALNLAIKPPVGQEKQAPDGFIWQDENGVVTAKESPIQFLNILMSTIRRSGQGVSKTHVGSVMNGRVLTTSDFVERMG